MSGVGLESLPAFAVRQANAAVASTARDENVGVCRVVEKDQIPHRPIVHRELQLSPDLAFVRLEGHQPNGLVVGPGRKQLAGVAEARAVHAAAVLFRT